MNKLIVCTALIAISLQGNLCAQSSYISKLMSRSKTDQTFNAGEGLLNIRDFVVLKEGRLILDLSCRQDYESFRNMDSLLAVFMKDIAFYKDSLKANPTGHVRIDYALNSEYSLKKIRFKQYPSDGNIFMNRDGEVARLKFEEDTVRILIQKSKPGIGHGPNGPCTISYAIQATFLLGNYTDINKLLAGKVLNKIVDTLEKSSGSAHARHEDYPNPSSIIYNPYSSSKNSLKRYEWKLSNEWDLYPYRHKSRYMSVNANIGAGLVRNMVAPMADLGIQYNKYMMGNTIDHNILRLSVTPYFLFEKNADGTSKMTDSWFANIAIGSIYSSEGMPGWLGKEVTFGAGYLFVQKGNYFRNTTVKIFTDLLVTHGLTIVPELIATDNFKQIFPGITVKVF